MVDRYNLEIDETSRYRPYLMERESAAGEWVRYEDVKDLVEPSIQSIFDQHKSLTDSIESRWKGLTGKRRLSKWEVFNDNIVIEYELSVGSFESWTYYDRIPIKCFEVSLEEAKLIYESSKNHL